MEKALESFNLKGDTEYIARVEATEQGLEDLIASQGEKAITAESISRIPEKTIRDMGFDKETLIRLIKMRKGKFLK